MKNVCKRVSKANVEREQYFPESFQLSRKIQLFPRHKLEYIPKIQRSENSSMALS